MEKAIELSMDDFPVRFTPEGDVFVLDAIGALSKSDDPANLWDALKQKNPDLVSGVTKFKTDEARSVHVAGTDAWEKIQNALIDMLFFKEK